MITSALTVDVRRTSRVLRIVLHRCKLDHALYLGADFFSGDHSLHYCAAPFRSNSMSKLTLFGLPAASLLTYFQLQPSDNMATSWHRVNKHADLRLFPYKQELLQFIPITRITFHHTVHVPRSSLWPATLGARALCLHP